MPTPTFSDEAKTKLLLATQRNIERVYGDPATTARDRESIDELLTQKAWTELDDRFFRDIAFGTGGMRGRTAGKIVTKAEAGRPQPLGRPEFPGAGTNMLNFENVHRAVSALGAYLLEGYPGEHLSVVIAHDTRFFSREFSLQAAEALNALGIDALLFAEDRSTPQLSFSVRHCRAHAGIMITASHNPPHDNGMKFYSRDGGQVVEPHASGITKKFQEFAANPAALSPLLRTTELKELNFHMNIGEHEHDYGVKMRHAEEFLWSGEKVSLQLKFRGVEMTQQAAGMNLIRRMRADLSHIGIASNEPKLIGKSIYLVLSPLPVEKRVRKFSADHGQPAKDEAPSDSGPGRIVTLDEKVDRAYQDAVADLVLEPDAISATREKIKFVYTPLHGTGARATPALLDRFGFRYTMVEAQSRGDGRFPTVKSPNPENAEALELAIRQAEAENADIVMATDPDADRMGVAVRDAGGKMILLTGNMIGSIMAYYRCSRLTAQGVLTEANRKRGVVIKTFVTTDLQKRIAEKFGVGCIDTLTGFKYIGEKMYDYEKALNDPGYGGKSAKERRAEALARGHFLIFGGEESYGYTGGDYVRDKDANAAVLMFAEVAAWAKSQGRTLAEYLDAIYREAGFYTERLGTLTFEGAQGAQQIAKLLASFRAQPPSAYQGQAVTRVEDFGLQDFHDADGKKIPKETMLLFHLADGSRMAVRGSGTEPKIKFYFFTRADASGDLEAIKKQRKAFLESWWAEVQEDVKKRVG